MKRLIALLFMFCLVFGGAQGAPIYADTLPSEVRVISVSATIYSEASLSSPMMTGESELKVEHGRTFSVIGESGDFYQISFTITIGETQTQTTGYLLKAYCLDTSIKGQHVNIQTNAHLRNDSVVYNLNGENYEESEISLEKDFRVRLVDGFDQSLRYTRVMFDYNGETLMGYISTGEVIPDGISMNTAIAIGLIIASVSIILILFGFSRHNKRKKKKQQKTA